MKAKELSEFEDEMVGRKGTPERDQWEAEKADAIKMHKKNLRLLMSSINGFHKARHKAVDNIAKVLSQTDGEHITFDRGDFELTEDVDWVSELYLRKGQVMVKTESLYKKPRYAQLLNRVDVDVMRLCQFLVLSQCGLLVPHGFSRWLKTNHLR